MKLKSTFLATTAVLAAGNALAVDVTAYGQVNKLIGSFDNGADKKVAIVDNDASSTRFGFKAQQQLNNGLVVSGLLELQTESDSSSSVTPGNDKNEEGNSISERHSRIGLSSSYGTFLIGKTSEATDGISEMDLGGVSDVMYSDVTAVGGGVNLVQKDGTVLTSERTAGNLYSNIDGGRTNLVRYDSPAINGVSASTSVSSGSDMAFAVKYAGKVDRFKIKAGLGYKNHQSSDAQVGPTGSKSTIDKDISGSLSVKCETSGVAATVAMGQRDFKDSGRKDAKFMYTKLSYMPVESNFEYAVDYGTSKSSYANNETLNSLGLGTQYNIAKGVSTSLTYRDSKADKLSNNEKADKVQVIAAGLKVKF